MAASITLLLLAPVQACVHVLTQSWRVCVVGVCLQVCLPAIWALSFLLVTYRLGVLPAESAASLKLLDKGVAKEALAALVLVQFPVELVSAVVAGRCEEGFLGGGGGLG